jgi:hypothetical protein
MYISGNEQNEFCAKCESQEGFKIIHEEIILYDYEVSRFQIPAG